MTTQISRGVGTKWQQNCSFTWFALLINLRLCILLRSTIFVISDLSRKQKWNRVCLREYKPQHLPIRSDLWKSQLLNRPNWFSLPESKIPISESIEHKGNSFYATVLVLSQESVKFIVRLCFEHVIIKILQICFLCNN